jgi:hypothetical protein
MGDALGAAPGVLDREVAEDRVAEDGDSLEAVIGADRLEIVGEDVGGHVRGLAGRSAAASKVDVDQAEVVDQGSRQELARRPRSLRSATSRPGPTSSGPPRATER